MNLFLKRYFAWMSIGVPVTAFNCTLLHVSWTEDKQQEVRLLTSVGIGFWTSISTSPVYPLTAVLSSAELIHECMDRWTGRKARRKLEHEDLIAERDMYEKELAEIPRVMGNIPWREYKFEPILDTSRPTIDDGRR